MWWNFIALLDLKLEWPPTRPSVAVSSGGERYAAELQLRNRKTSPSHVQLLNLKHWDTKLLFGLESFSLIYFLMIVISVHVCVRGVSLTGLMWDAQRVDVFTAACALCSSSSRDKGRSGGERGEEGNLMKPSLCDKESHQSPWCVTWPGPCHHRAPVVAEKYPPRPPPHPPLPFPHHWLRERERRGDT